MNTTAITISATINSTLEKTWECYNSAYHIIYWNFPSEDWHCPSASVDLQPGGEHKARMESKDGKMGFDFEAVYTEVSAPNHVAYTIADGRKVNTHFSETDGGILVTTIFEPEETHDPAFQRAGWEAILNNFKSYVETKA